MPCCRFFYAIIFDFAFAMGAGMLLRYLRYAMLRTGSQHTAYVHHEGELIC